MDLAEFRTWLIVSVHLSERSAKDVVSRIRRASGIVTLHSRIATDDLLHLLSKQDDFKALTATVKSQMRRAIKLYRQWASSHSN